MNIKPLINIFLIMLSFPIYAADVLVYINGSVVENTCSISIASKEQYINLGTWPSKQFINGSKTTPMKFNINLENCNSLHNLVSGVNIKFNGIQDSFDNKLLSLNENSSAKNIGVAILDKEKNIIPIGNDFYYTFESKNENISLDFFGQYIATSDKVTPGTANADAIFTLTYQ